MNPNLINQIKQNPIGFISKTGFNIPQNISNNPNDIIQYLMNTGQISQSSYNQAIKKAQSMGFKI